MFEPSELASEVTVQKILMRLYDAIVDSAKNTELLSAKDPADIRIEECAGGKWSKDSVMTICDWLNTVKAVSSKGVFEAQVLGPVRAAAGFLAAVRRLPKPTTDVDAWVFGVSRPYRYEYYDADKITAFAVVPRLEAVMSVRLDASFQDRVKVGFYRMGGAQPIPLANRIHQTRPVLEKIGGRPDLAGWDFLKVGFGDLEYLGSCAELEHFFEAESSQSAQRQHLGSAFILACKIAEVREPNVVVQSVHGREIAEMTLSGNLAASGNLGVPEGGHARVLAVRWYGEVDEKLPEIFAIEPISEREALADEIAGRVRVRGSIPLEEIKGSLVRTTLSEIKVLSVKNGEVSYVHKIYDSDPVADAFLKASERLRGLRARPADESPFVDWRDVLVKDKVGARELARRFESRPRLRDVLGLVQAHIDRTGEAASEGEIAESAGLEIGAAKRQLWELKRLGLAEKKAGRVWSTGEARAVLAEAFSERMAGIEAASDVLSVPEIAGVPQSAAIARLSRAGGEFAPLRGGVRLYWVRKGAGEAASLEAENKLKEIRRGVLGIARAVHFPVTAKYIAQEAEKAGLPVSCLVAEVVAEGLVRDGKFLQSGESWEYPVAERVADFLSENAGEFSVDEIVSRARVAGSDRALVVEALRVLAKEGRAAQMSGEIWAREGGEERVLAHCKKKIKGRAIKLIRARKRGVDRGVLVGYLRKFVSDIDSERCLTDPGKAVVDALAELEKDGRVASDDDLFRVRD